MGFLQALFVLNTPSMYHMEPKVMQRIMIARNDPGPCLPSTHCKVVICLLSLSLCLLIERSGVQSR